MIAGSYADSDHASHGFVRTPDGTFTTFDAPAGNLGILAGSINNNADIAGFFLDQNGAQHGFVRSADGTFTPFDAPGPGTAPLSINLKGEITGVYSANGETAGFIRKANGRITSFRAPHSNGYTQPEGINSAGAVAGFAYIKSARHTFEITGFIRTP